MFKKVIRIGLITAAALRPAKPVPSPAPIPARKVTIIVISIFISKAYFSHIVINYFSFMKYSYNNTPFQQIYNNI